jgi:hypothetical protein
MQWVSLRGGMQRPLGRLRGAIPNVPPPAGCVRASCPTGATALPVRTGRAGSYTANTVAGGSRVRDATASPNLSQGVTLVCGMQSAGWLIASSSSNDPPRGIGPTRDRPVTRRERANPPPGCTALLLMCTGCVALSSCGERGTARTSCTSLSRSGERDAAGTVDAPCTCTIKQMQCT